jgi:hypothetical protein
VALCHWPCCCRCRPCRRRRRPCCRRCLHRRACRRRCRHRRHHFHRCRHLRRRHRRRSLPRTSRKSSPRPRRPPTHPSPRARSARQTGCTSTPQRLSPGNRPSHRTTLGGSVDRRSLGLGGKLLLLVLGVTEVLQRRTWLTLPFVAGATRRTLIFLVLAHGQMEEKRELEKKQQMIRGCVKTTTGQASYL